MSGAVHAGQVLVGKAAARSLPATIGLPVNGMTGIATQAAVGLVAAMVARRFLSREAADYILAGALSAPLESVVIQAGVPILSQALSGGAIGNGNGVSSYPEVPGAGASVPLLPGMGSYPAGPDFSMAYDYASM